MAGEWIKIDDDLPDKPEVIAMAERLGISQEEVVGHLVRVWAWADRHLAVTLLSRSCHAPSVTPSSLDRVARRDGMVDALVAVGWLELGEAGGVTFPGWHDHMSKSAKARHLARKRQQEKRARDVENCHAPVTQMSRSERDASVTRDRDRESLSLSSSEESSPSLKSARAAWEEIRERLDAALRAAGMPGVAGELFPSQVRLERLEMALRQCNGDVSVLIGTLERELPLVHPTHREAAYFRLDWLLRPERLAELAEGAYRKPRLGSDGRLDHRTAAPVPRSQPTPEEIAEDERRLDEVLKRDAGRKRPAKRTTAQDPPQEPPREKRGGSGA